MAENYDGISVYKLGRLIAQKIDTYSKDQTTRNLEEIFPLLIGMGTRIIKSRYRAVDLFVLEDAIQQIAEDMLIRIYQDPTHFLDFDNFYPYYRRAMLGRTAEFIKEFYGSYKRIVYLDEYDETIVDLPLHSILPPTDIMSRKDSFKQMIKEVLYKIENCPRFNQKPAYLIWPMILSILHQENRFFDSLDFRDRVGLKILRNTLVKNHLYV